MARVIISDSLKKAVISTFKSQSLEIFKLMKSLELHPKKGKSLSHVENVVIKELKYKKFRFYFVTDGYKLKFGTEDELTSLLIKFVKMSDQKNQKEVLKSIKETLKSLGFDTFK